ncbi:MAG: hypothetical protein ACE5FG_09340 [Myxococcota bacterium]
MTRARRAALLLAVLGLAACRTPQPPATIVLGEEGRVAVWLEHLETRAKERHSVRAQGKLHLRGPDGSGSARQVLLAERPSRLRLESLNLWGQVQTLLVTDGERFAFYDGHALERGALHPDLLRERLGLDLEPEEAVQQLLGIAPLPEGSGDPHLRILAVWAIGDDRIVELPDRRLRFAADGTLRGAERLDADGNPRWRAHYARWRELPAGLYPFEMSFEFPSTGLQAKLELREVELDPLLDASLFRIAPRGSE